MYIMLTYSYSEAGEYKRAPDPRRSRRLIKRTSQGCAATSSIIGDRSIPGPETGVSWRARETVHRHEEANHEQGYGQEEGSEEEAGKVSAGKARCEAGKETEPRVSGLRCPRP